MGLRMLQDRYLSVAEARTTDSLRDQVINFAHSLDFGIVSAMAVEDHSLTHTAFHCVNNIPTSYTQMFNDIDMGRADPVMQHCKRSSIPIIWDQGTYVANNLGELWEEQARHGLCAGIGLALHMPNDTHFFIGVDSDRPFNKSSKAMTRIVASMQLFAVHAQEAAFNIFMPPPAAKGGHPSLTARELEALRWTLNGKTAWEIGELLNIAERTAVFHLRNAMRKLQCSSKHQAVLKAFRLGLL